MSEWAAGRTFHDIPILKVKPALPRRMMHQMMRVPTGCSSDGDLFVILREGEMGVQLVPFLTSKDRSCT